MARIPTPINIIECDVCGSANIKVIDTDKDLIKYEGVIYRRKKCLSCGRRFTTYEIHADDFKELFPNGRINK